MRLDPEQMRRRATAARSARLATLGGDGRPHLVPITFALDGDDLWTAVDHKPKSTTQLARLRNIAGDPRVSVLIDHYAEDWSALWWVRLDGVARVLRGGDRPARARDLLRDKYPQYRAVPVDGPVIAVAIERWRGWAAA